MADEVIIGNVGGDGVASEATLAALVRAVERMGNARGQKGAGDKTQALANKAIASGTTATTENTRSVTGNTGAVNKSAAALGKFSKDVGIFAIGAIGTAIASIGAMSKELLAGNESMEAYASKIPLVGGLLGALAGYADRSVDAFRELSSVGAGFSGDISAMRRSAAEMQVPLSEFKDIIMRNSEAFALFGGTVSGGIARFKEMNKNLKDTGDFETLKALGFTVQEVNEGMGDYLSIQQNLGRTQGRSTKELAAGSAAYMLELDRLATITGKSRKELADSMNKQSADMHMQALLNGLNAEQQKELIGAMTQAKALMPGFSGALQDLADGIPQTDLGRTLASLSPAIAQAAAALGKGEITQAEFMMKLKREGGPALQSLVKNMNAAQIEALKTQPGFSELLGSMGELNKFIDSNYDPATAEAENKAKLKAAQDREKVTAKLTQFQDAIRKVSEALQIAFLDSGLLDLFATGIGMAATLITGMAESIKEFTAKFKEDPAGAILNLIGDGIKGLFSNTTVVAALVGGIAALFLGKAALGAMSSAMSGWAEKSIGKIFGGGAGPLSQAASPLAGAGPAKGSSAGKGFGQAIGNIGKGLGTGIGGILKGLASGLAAFANPAILIGAGILGGAIVAIGAGIAGAAWILGKALPTFAEGLKSFADIDGENLLNVAKGIAGVGAALAVFGAGAVIGSVGAVISNILDALPGKSPLEKLKEFADADLNTQRITNNANAMVAYSNAMKGFSGGPAPDLFAAFKTGIINLLGGSTDILAPIKAFGDIKFNTSGIIENATAVKAYSDAMKGFSGGPAPDLFASLKDGIPLITQVLCCFHLGLQASQSASHTAAQALC